MGPQPQECQGPQQELEETRNRFSSRVPRGSMALLDFGLLVSKSVKEYMNTFLSFHGGSDGKESVCNAGDPGSALGSGRFPGEGNGYPLQYSCLENPMTDEPGGLQSMGSKE